MNVDGCHAHKRFSISTTDQLLLVLPSERQRESRHLCGVVLARLVLVLSGCLGRCQLECIYQRMTSDFGAVEDNDS